MSIEEHDYHVDPVREPLDNAREVVASVDGLFGARQNPGSIQEVESVEDGAVEGRCFESLEEVVSEASENFVWVPLVDYQRVSGNDLQDEVFSTLVV